jgi:hypothetical protein
LGSGASTFDFIYNTRMPPDAPLNIGIVTWPTDQYGTLAQRSCLGGELERRGHRVHSIPYYHLPDQKMVIDPASLRWEPAGGANSTFSALLGQWAPTLDLLVVGSDRIWDMPFVMTSVWKPGSVSLRLPDEKMADFDALFGGGLARTLLGDRVPVVSYAAAGLGWSVHASLSRHLKALLSGMAAISVRDAASVRLLEAADISAVHLLDPTTLENCSLFTRSRSPHANTIFLYGFDAGFAEYERPWKLAQAIADRTTGIARIERVGPYSAYLTGADVGSAIPSNPRIRCSCWH